jgi:hypothetical protein
MYEFNFFNLGMSPNGSDLNIFSSQIDFEANRHQSRFASTLRGSYCLELMIAHHNHILHVTVDPQTTSCPTISSNQSPLLCHIGTTSCADRKSTDCLNCSLMSMLTGNMTVSCFFFVTAAILQRTQSGQSSRQRQSRAADDSITSSIREMRRVWTRAWTRLQNHVERWNRCQIGFNGFGTIPHHSGMTWSWRKPPLFPFNEMWVRLQSRGGSTLAISQHELPVVS